jgi:voltage-dependent potassium channel beta subunit
MERKDDLMEYRTLGASGLKVSRLSLGSALVWGKEDQSACDDVVKLAWESGINFFDTSEAYGDGISE